MKNLHHGFHMSTEPQMTTEEAVSHILMGFVERKVSPQTIADVLRARIFESGAPARLLNAHTCNGILEAVTHASATEECSDLVFYLASHPEFPHFTSFKAAAGSLRILLRYLQEQALPENHNQFKMEGIIEALSDHLLSFFHEKTSLDLPGKSALAAVLHSLPPTLVKRMRNSPRFQHLRFILMTPPLENTPLENISHSSLLPEPLEMLQVILKTPDEQLEKTNPSHYKTKPNSRGASARLKHFHSIIGILSSSGISELKAGFLVEWLFDKALAEAVLQGEEPDQYILFLKYTVEKFGEIPSILRGLLKSIQKDFSFLGSYPVIQKFDTTQTPLTHRAMLLAHHIFPLLVNLTRSHPQYVARHIANWAMGIPISDETYRFFKRSQWRWVRSLAEQCWDDSLREPPLWIIEGGSFYCALIFRCAPAMWLQEHSFILLEKVYQETLVENFTPGATQYDYVEFLVRCMRKKSPFFASRTESLYALHLLSRQTNHEALLYENMAARFHTQLSHFVPEQGFTSPELALWHEILFNPNIANTLGNNPVTQALAVLVRLARETSKK